MTRPSRAKFAAGASSALAGIAISTRPARAARFSWKWATDQGPGDSIPVRAVEAFAKIRKDTSGDLDIKAFTNSSLGGNTSIVRQLRLGALEMLSTGGSAIESLAPAAGVENVAFAFTTRKAAFAATEGELGQIVRDQALKVNIVLFERMFETGYRQFTSWIKPIHTVSDLEGLKLRVPPGKIRTDTFASLGCSAVTVEPNEMYTALQTHICDAMETSLATIESYRIFEVQKYCSITNHMWSGHWTYVNLDKWNSLPPAYQHSLRTHMNEAATLQRRDFELGSNSLQDLLHRQGLAFNTTTPDSFRGKLIAGGYYKRCRASFGDQVWAALEKYTGPLA